MTPSVASSASPPAPTPLAPQRPGQGQPQSGELSPWPVPADKQAGVYLHHTLISFFFFNSWPVLAKAEAPNSLISLMFSMKKLFVHLDL